jgi:hypothetical protein
MMNEPTNPMNKPTEPITGDKQRGISVVELLFAAATIGATVLMAAMPYTKKPPLSGD